MSEHAKKMQRELRTLRQVIHGLPDQIMDTLPAREQSGEGVEVVERAWRDQLHTAAAALIKSMRRGTRADRPRIEKADIFALVNCIRILTMPERKQ